MCGLVVIARPAGLADHERAATLEAMRDALAHRGPDDATAAVVDGWVALGHRRLSILDLAGSRQPLSDERGQVVCVFNGEIYNFQELRSRLEALGHRFATQGDGEVIVHGYEEWGLDVAAALEGMFSFVLVDRARGRAALSRFAPMLTPSPSPGGPARSAGELVCQLREELTCAVRRQMVADVPVGAFLSGGIDSTLVVALMSRLARHRIHTFSVATGPGDESETAQATARLLGTEHHTVRLSAMPFAELGRLAELYDEPFAEVSALGVRALSLAAREHVAVALTGDGGDEVFGGYDTYRHIRNLTRLAAPLPTRLRAPVQRWALDRLRARAWPAPLRRGLRALSVLGLPPRQAQLWLLRSEPCVGEEVPRRSRSLTARIEDAVGADADALPPGRQAMAADRLERLPGAMLTKVDVASMSASLEVRVPLLDDALVRFADGLDEGALIGLRRGKLLLRRVLGDLVPALGHLATAKKRGFAIPMHDWLRQDRSRQALSALFAEERERISALTGFDAVARLRVFDRSGARDPCLVSSNEVLWLANVGLWARRFGVTSAARPELEAAPLV